MRTYKALNRHIIRSAMRDAYISNPTPQKEAVRKFCLKESLRDGHMPLILLLKRRLRGRGIPTVKIFSFKKYYACKPDSNKRAARMRYLRQRSAILQGRCKQHQYFMEELRDCFVILCSALKTMKRTKLTGTKTKRNSR